MKHRFSFFTCAGLFCGLFLMGCGTVAKTTGAGWMSSLMKNEWSVSGLGVESGVVDMPHIRFESDGKLTGSTGCNMFMGTYRFEGDKLKMDPGATTKKYCEGAQEQKFLEAIRKATDIRQSGKGLELLDDKSAVLMQLRPKK